MNMPTPALGALFGVLAAFALKGAGHQREPMRSVAFNGPADVLSQIRAKQLVMVPSFVCSDGLLAALRKSRSQAAPERHH